MSGQRIGYTIYFKGRSFRTIVPANSNKIVLDFDFENG